MGFSTKTVLVNSGGWTLVTSKPALIQFNDEMYMVLSDSDIAPADSVGFKMDKDEKYVSTTTGVRVWVRAIPGGTKVESVRIAEETII